MTVEQDPASRRTAGWRTSTRSGGGECVEVFLEAGAPAVLLRDSKDRPGPALRFGANAWEGFITAIKGDRLH